MDCLLLSKGVVNIQCLINKLEEQVDDPTSGIENSSNTRLVVISGGHGSDKKLDHGAEGTILKEVAYGATSCYSSLGEFVDYEFYKLDCKDFGTEPQPDPLIYDSISKMAVGVDQEKASENIPEWGECCRKKLNKINVVVLNIANYHNSIDGIDDLVHDLNKLSPTILAIAWCFSINDDLAMALRANGYFSKMLVNHDLREITGNSDAKISDEQAQFLRDALDDENQHFLVTGPKGSGKTILAAEIAKIKFAKLIQSGKKARFIVRLHATSMTTKYYIRGYSKYTPMHASQLAIDFRRRYLNGFELENNTVKNISIVYNNANDADAADFYSNYGGDDYDVYEKYSEKDFHKWITDTYKESAQEENIVVILDDFKATYLENFLSLSDLSNGSIICCLSTSTRIEGERDQWRKKGWHIPSVKLEKSYRYTPEIAEFLHYHGKELQETVSPPEVDCSHYPQPLSEYEHPVIWLQAKDIYWRLGLEETLLSMSEDIKKVGKKSGASLKVLCIADEVIWDAGGRKGASDGSEADIVIINSDHYYLEYFSRARKQLIILTHGKDDPRYEDIRITLTEFYRDMGYSDEKVADALSKRDIHSRLNLAWASKSRFRAGRKENRRVMKVEVTEGMLGDGTWLDKVKRGGPQFVVP